MWRSCIAGPCLLLLLLQIPTMQTDGDSGLMSVDPKGLDSHGNKKGIDRLTYRNSKHFFVLTIYGCSRSRLVK
jgi:hypothetical protein